jgi:hypothetical protein
VISGIEQLENCLTFGPQRARRIAAVRRTHFDFIEPVIRPNPRAKIRERVGDIALTDFSDGDEPDVQAAGSRLAAAARMSSGNARSLSRA